MQVLIIESILMLWTLYLHANIVDHRGLIYVIHLTFIVIHFITCDQQINWFHNKSFFATVGDAIGVGSRKTLRDLLSTKLKFEVINHRIQKVKYNKNNKVWNVISEIHTT